MARLRAALQRAIARRRELQRRGTPHFARPGVDDAGSTRIFYLLADDPLFLELADYPPVMPYIRALLNQSQPHFHASDAFWEEGAHTARAGWHIDGPDNGFRNLRPRVPMQELKIGYFLSDMTQPDQGNLMVVLGSHKTDFEPTAEALGGFDTFPGATQVCCPIGSCVIFRNALWHTRGPSTGADGRRRAPHHALLRLRAPVDDRQPRAHRLPARVLRRAVRRPPQAVPRLPVPALTGYGSISRVRR